MHEKPRNSPCGQQGLSHQTIEAFTWKSVMSMTPTIGLEKTNHVLSMSILAGTAVGLSEWRWQLDLILWFRCKHGNTAKFWESHKNSRTDESSEEKSLGEYLLKKKIRADDKFRAEVKKSEAMKIRAEGEKSEAVKIWVKGKIRVKDKSNRGSNFTESEIRAEDSILPRIKFDRGSNFPESEIRAEDPISPRIKFDRGSNPTEGPISPKVKSEPRIQFYRG